MRHSLDLKYISENSNETGGSIMPSPGNQNMATPPKLQSSFSANDVPTVKNPAGSSMNANNHAQLHFHNHNASLGRIPVGAVPRGHTRELSAESVNTSREQAGAFQSIQTALQASAAPFGPSTTTAAPPASAHVSSPSGNPSMSSFNNGFYQANGYHNPNPNHQGAPHPASPFNVSMLAAGMQQMNINGANGGGMYPQQNYPGYGSLSYGQGNQPRDSQARVIQHRRQLDNEGQSSKSET